ncbi:hypothetical protein BK411_03860 [Vibrio splendidus]|nr:hypothetical protein BK411_03860 [Vibrio splendidus]
MSLINMTIYKLNTIGKNVSKRNVVEIAGVFILETYLIGWMIYASDTYGECFVFVIDVIVNCGVS